MSKNKRKVTVDADERKKPSVFERLGPNALKRPVGKYNESDSDEHVQRCRNWDTTGSCPYGKKCKFLHDPKSKLVGKDESQEDLRLRVKHKAHKQDSRHSDSEESAEKDYDYKEKLELERERQLLKRQLSQLEDDDKDVRENFRIESRLQKVSSSDSDSSGDSRSRSKTRKQAKKKKKKKQASKSSTKLKMPSPGPGIDSDDHQRKHKKKSKKKHSRADSLSDFDRSSEPEQKGRKLLSPLKFKKSKPVVSNAIQGFHSDDEPDSAPLPPKMKLTMPSRSPPLGIVVPPLPRMGSTRSRSVSSEEGRRAEKMKDISSVSPVKKKKGERRVSPEFEREPKVEKVRGSRRQTKSRSPIIDRSLSFSPDGKKARKAEKKKKKKDAGAFDKSKDTSLDRSRGHESRDRELSPVSDYRSSSPVKKKKKDKKNKEKKKDRAPPVREDVVVPKNKKDKMKARDRSVSPVVKKMEKSSLDRSRDRKELEPRGRSPIGSKMSRSPVPPRRARSPDPVPRADRELDRRDRDVRDAREPLDMRVEAGEFRGDSRGSRNEPREPRADHREPRGDSRELRGDSRDLRGDHRDSRLDPRDSRVDHREARLDIREPRIESRDSRTDIKDSRLDSRDRALDPRDSRLELRLPPRDKDSRSLRDARPDPRDRETRDREPLREPLRTDTRDRDIRGIHEFREEPLDSIDPRDRDIRDRPPIVDRDYERDLPPPVEVLPERRDRFPDDRFRDEPRRDRYDDARFPPPPLPPPAPSNYDDRPPRYGRGEPVERFPDPGDRGPTPYGRPDRDIPGDRRGEPMDMPYDRYGQQNRADNRYGMGRGGRFDYQREEGPNWDRGDRGRGRNRGNWNRGAPPERGGRYDDRSRRGEWENQRQRNDDFYSSERRDWPDHKDADRKDDRREPVKDESREKRDDKPDADRDLDRDVKENDRVPRDKEPKEKESRDKELKERDKEEQRSARSDDRREERTEDDKDKKDDKAEKKEETKNKDTDSDSKKRDDERSRDRDRSRQKDRVRDKDDDRRERGRSKESDKRERGRGDKESMSSRSRDGEVDREKRREDSSDRSRKRKASRSRTRSPSVKKPKDGSPALSTHSKHSAREPVVEKEPAADKHSDRESVAGSERSKKAESTRSRSRRSRRDEDRQSKRESDTEDRKRSRSRSHSHDSKDSKRQRLDSFPEGAGALAGYVIKDTVGSDREDNNLDNIEQNFSDWSDDSADDILNRPGETSPKKDTDVSKDTVPGSSSPHGSEGSRHSGTAQEEKLDSEDEGGLVERVKMAAVDALEIDWSSLMKDERPKPQTGSALNRFKPGAIFARIGLSRQFAGDKLFSQVLDVCQKHDSEQKANDSQSDLNDSKTETAPDTPDIKKVETTLSEDSKVDVKHSPLKVENSSTQLARFNFLSDVAMFHASGLQKLKERTSLMSNIGPFRRALCARRDLEMRRQLCKADKVLDSRHLYSSQDMDVELFRLSVQMLRNAQEPSGQSKPEVMTPTTPVKPVGSPVYCP